LLAALVEDGFTGRFAGTGVVGDVFLRLEPKPGLIGQAGISRQDGEEFGLAGVLRGERGGVGVVGMFGG